MSTIGIAYDQMNESVYAQIVRDFLCLASEFPGLKYSDPAGQMNKSIMEDLGIDNAGPNDVPTLNIVYKVGTEYPEYDERIRTVRRDLCPHDTAPSLTQNDDNKVGYYLKPQGRAGANLTERYLNRSYPKGRGVTNPLVLMMWG